MALEVIGAGLGRTGSDSLRSALEQLGFGPCHHMFELRDNPALVAPWEAVVRGERPDWDSMFQGYRAQVDWPGAHFWRPLAAHYPSAKVVLSVRDPRAWYRSFQQTIAQFLAAGGTHSQEHLNRIADFMKEVLGDRMKDESAAVAAFNAHVDEVKATIEPGRLLVYELGSGWGPLCEFLGVEVPRQAYPKTNSTAEFQQSTADRAAT